MGRRSMGLSPRYKMLALSGRITCRRYHDNARKAGNPDYRSCLETSISFQPDLSVLIGPNGSGKTNVLQAILLLKKLADDRPHPLFQRSPIEPLDETHLTAGFRLDDKIVTLKADVLLDTDEENADVPLGTRNVWVAKDFTGTNKQIEIPLAIVAFLAGGTARIHCWVFL